MRTNFNFTNSIAIIIMFTLFTCSFTLVSCSKPEDGAIGPTGTANVIYSSWTGASESTTTTIDNTNGITASIAATQLNQEILDKGTVLLYGKFSTTVFPLPYVSYAGGSANTLTFFPELKNIRLFRFKHDGTGGISISAFVAFRYILIPGGTAADSGKRVQPNFKKMSYAEVCHYLQIPE
jgi:hypothetical protein